MQSLHVVENLSGLQGCFIKSRREGVSDGDGDWDWDWDIVISRE